MTLPTSSVSGREITISRILHAPRELVFEVWTKPEHIAQWWGPNGFTTTIHEMNVSPGGEWNFIMHGPDGTDYRNEIRYIEIEKPRRIVYFHGPSPRFQVTITFEEDGMNTLLTMRSLFESIEETERVIRVFKAVEGGTQTLNRLAGYLEDIKRREEE